MVQIVIEIPHLPCTKAQFIGGILQHVCAQEFVDGLLMCLEEVECPLRNQPPCVAHFEARR
jgi:hypothetical protein